MYQKNHVGVVKKTVVLEFENGYSIILEAGVEMSMSLTMNEAAQHSVQSDGATDQVCPECGAKLSWCAECEKHVTPRR